MTDYDIFISGKSGSEVNDAVSAMTVAVDSLPDVSQVSSLNNKIYIRTTDNTMWHVQQGQWVRLGVDATTSIGGHSGTILIANQGGQNGTIVINNTPQNGQLMTVQSMPYIDATSGTNLPQSINTAGGIIPVICSSSPSTMYAGYMYILVEAVS